MSEETRIKQQLKIDGFAALDSKRKFIKPKQFQIYDQNAPRVNKKVPIIASLHSEEEAMNHIKSLHPNAKIMAEPPPFGLGYLVFINGDYSYFVG